MKGRAVHKNHHNVILPFICIELFPLNQLFITDDWQGNILASTNWIKMKLGL